jgi:threonine dehydratase
MGLGSQLYAKLDRGCMRYPQNYCGAGAAPLAGLIRERARYTGQRVATVFSGANIDATMPTEVLAGRTPQI